MTTPNSELCAMGVCDLARLYRERQLSPAEVVRATIDRIERLNPELNAYIAVLSDSAMAAARAAEAQLAAGIDLGPLHGVPVSVKDIIGVKGTRTTAASRVLIDAPLDAEDATVVRRLRAAGAIVVGKVNLHEFAFGDPDPDGPFGNVQNPRKVGHQSGGSSSGSGAATAGGLGVVSLGTDTGGSIRHPASACGVVGLKPTYGLVPVHGVVPLSAHLDHVGPLGRSVADVAAGLAAIAGPDPQDPYSVEAPGSTTSRLSVARSGGSGGRAHEPVLPLRPARCARADRRRLPRAGGLRTRAHSARATSGSRRPPSSLVPC